jgi:DNA (cytosine-5)-methyltransferase 1
MKILNLYAGLGGNRKLWQNHNIIAVEYTEKIAQVYKNNFPNDNVIIADAHQYLLDHHKEFDFIWSSPPCQSHSRMVKATRHKINKYPDMALYQEIIFLQHFYKGFWVVENVKPYYDPLIKPTAIIGRHYFWSNYNITAFNHINHQNFITSDSPEQIENFKNWLGINYDGNIYYEKNHSPGQVLRNCVHPEIGLHILNCVWRTK